MTGSISLVRPMFRGLVAVFLAVTGVALTSPAQAQIGSERYSSIVVDAASGNVLAAANADEFRYPASLTKMMTIYMLFEAVRDRRISLNDPVPVSASAASMPPTKLGLLPGTYITVEQALLGLVTKSANDAAAALGEMMGGDEDRFAQMMIMKTAEQFVTFGQGNVEALVKSSQIIATGLQDMTKQFAATAQATMDETLSTFRAMTSVRSVKEALELQATLARSTFEKAVAQSGQVTETSFKLAEQAMAPIASRMNLAVESFKAA